jgi:predicted RNA-binding Zn ribbon-like protein
MVTVWFMLLLMAVMQQTPAMFIAGDPALDFLNSVATPIDVRVEWLDDGEGLLSWLRQAQLVSGALLKRARSQFSASDLNKIAEEARNLREWFRGFVQAHRGRPLTRDDLKKLERLNRLLERDESYRQIAPATAKQGKALELQVMRKWRSPEALLFPIAEAIARFVSSEDFTHVKACEGPNCTLVFADQTRSRARRWCSMAICGNRAKQAAHRHRQKAHR